MAKGYENIPPRYIDPRYYANAIADMTGSCGTLASLVISELYRTHPESKLTLHDWYGAGSKVDALAKECPDILLAAGVKHMKMIFDVRSNGHADAPRNVDDPAPHVPPPIRVNKSRNKPIELRSKTTTLSESRSDATLSARFDADADADAAARPSPPAFGGFDARVTLEDLRREQASFARARDWDQFHSPRNVLLAMVGEVGEVSELFQWRGDDDCATGLPSWSREDRARLEDELADVQLYLVRLADRCGVDLAAATRAKMAKNAAKYPADRCRGSAAKYTAYAEEGERGNAGPGEDERPAKQPARGAPAGAEPAAAAAQSAAAAGGGANDVVIVEGTAGHEGMIIGHGGGTIRDLQDRFGVCIQLKRGHGVTEVIGPGAQGAAAAIREIISQVAVMGAPPGADRAAAGSVVGVARETIPCAGAESRLIGKGGNNIRSLRERTGASIRVLNDSQGV